MKSRIEGKVSITAQGTCLVRAISYYEKDVNYKTNDHIAPIIVPSFLNLLTKYGFYRVLLKKMFLKAPGNCEYLIARTKFIDSIFESIDDSIEQVLIFGAGFDSRAIRFKNKLAKTKIFELDAPITQQIKIDRIRGKNIEIPENLKFISIDFKKESLAKKLDEIGFDKNKKCLFLLEGLTMYLNQESIDNIFNLVNKYSGENSLIVFDYVSASMVRRENTYNDPKIKKHYQVLAKAGEKPSFMIDGYIQDFLAKYNLYVIDELDSARLAKRYFNKDDFDLIAQKFRVVMAKK
ncbi:SAM-dependent methyltransferase [Pelosinus sp. IPA-1]|uniref:class I SAM-dependent methyltransferase n=1 Tax=Pelosinus sp. IPA-1 TaxID=3029569 RepID=UPI00243615B2|nr:SAM-dependent methyltransferase [Pelosinus sp. IPA-1]GMA97719.1 S-adenosyl-L-methionine-dependent methyltransferase [Pelosinus sp. IPA-1]